MIRSLLAAAVIAATAQPALCETVVKEPWVRGIVAQQRATGAFMQLTSTQGGRLVGVSSAVAGVAEIHEMAMEGNVMRMRAASALELPAGKAVVLAPGGYHLMLMDLRRPLKAGETVTLWLVVEGRDGKRETIEVKAPVRALGDAQGMHKH